MKSFGSNPKSNGLHPNKVNEEVEKEVLGYSLIHSIPRMFTTQNYIIKYPIIYTLRA
ncbi:hypothetical protein LEP1GSC041_0459 [Leptospira noguchii str. 2006001870]|uniref:Uncharacterized protein n=1 Tax=Leptospira noguchii str. 2007001578 TaxID=1049974 RepID=A0ABN0IUT7_9LEPT|nr:hypothetical protein LEP1GSC041_0459 [Leptospira noguchii str. 2006001870]EMM98246.1 hypothetical protein LEP1GSC035_0018 [Leptospira noguchii str. 2007001578]